MANGRRFLNEQLAGSWLYHEHPWPAVLQHPSVVSQQFDQCRTGLMSRDGWPVKKRTELIASHPYLVHFFRNLDCNGTHIHQQLHGPHTAAAQVWTWNFASRIIDGIIKLRQAFARDLGEKSADYREYLEEMAYPLALPSVG